MAKTVRIINHAHDGYRRAGVAFDKGINLVAARAFTADQLAALQADPRLEVAADDPLPADETAVSPGSVAADSLGGGVTDTATAGEKKLKKPSVKTKKEG